MDSLQSLGAARPRLALDSLGALLSLHALRAALARLALGALRAGGALRALRADFALRACVALGALQALRPALASRSGLAFGALDARGSARDAERERLLQALARERRGGIRAFREGRDIAHGDVRLRPGLQGFRRVGHGLVGLGLNRLERFCVHVGVEGVAFERQALACQVRVPAAALRVAAAAGLGGGLAADLVAVRGHAARHLHDLLHDGGTHGAPVGVVASGNHVAHIHVYVVVRLDFHAALGLVLLELLLALFFELFFVGVAVVVQGRYLVHAKKALRVAHVARSVGVEVDYRAVFQLARTCADQVVDAPMHRREREVEQVGIDLVRVVHRGRQRNLHLAAFATHRDLAPVGLRHGLEAAVAVAEAVEGVTHRRIVGSGGEQPGKPHALDERRERIARLAADGQVSAARIGEQALARQDAVPGAAPAQNRARCFPASLVARLVDDPAILGAVDEYELALLGGLARAGLQFQRVLVAAESYVKLEFLDFADIAHG